jgi:SAM-dependent methyltransferase
VGDEPGGWEQWTWDSTLFEGAAEHYEQGRLPYAPGIVEALTEALTLDGTGRLLDVGCGPGTVSRPFARSFDEIVGLDADAGMVAEAARLAGIEGITNARWVHGRSEDLPAGLGRFRTITFAASFHWMDRPLVARTVRDMLEPRGAVVQIHSWSSGWPTEDLDPTVPFPPVPLNAIAGLRRRYLGPDRRAGQGIRNTSPSGEDAIFIAAGFAPATERFVPDGRVLERDVDDVVANVLSMSGTAPHLFGDRLGAFVADLRAVLHDASPTGRFAVLLPETRILIWRPDDRADRSDLAPAHV